MSPISSPDVLLSCDCLRSLALYASLLSAESLWEEQASGDVLASGVAPLPGLYRLLVFHKDASLLPSPGMPKCCLHIRTMGFWGSKRRFRLTARSRAPPRDLGQITVTHLMGLYRSRAFVESFRHSLLELFEHKLGVYRSPESLPVGIPLDADWTLPELNAYSSPINHIERQQQLIRSSRGHSAVAAALESVVNDPEHGLCRVQGRNEVTARLAGLLVAFSHNYRVVSSTFMNFALMAGPGSGKTRMGQVIAFVFTRSIILSGGTTALVTRGDLVGTHVGETAVKTRKRLMTSLEGVLFIDEAYALGRCDRREDEFGSEAVTELINFLDKAAGLIVVIVAGYQEKMQKCFFGSNEGLDRRFPYKFVLAPLRAAQLVSILTERLQRKGIITTLDTQIFMTELVEYLLQKHLLPNGAGDMQNIADTVVRTMHSVSAVQWGSSVEDTEAIILASIDEHLGPRSMALSVT